MANKSAIITGASRGIGRGISLELATIGYDLVVNYAGNKQAAGPVKHSFASLYHPVENVFHGLCCTKPDRSGLESENPLKAC